MLDNLTLDDIKNIIKEEGGYVSPITPPGPVTVIFTKCITPIYSGNNIIKEQYDKYSIEYQTMVFDDLEEFRKNAKKIIESSTKKTIFSLYTFIRKSDLEYMLRLGWLNNYYGEQVEVSVEEAKEIIKNPPKDVSYEYVQDLKNIYCL